MALVVCDISSSLDGYVTGPNDSCGAVVMGRKSFDKNEGDGGWGDKGPVGDVPCFVVTHHQPTVSYPRCTPSSLTV